MATAPEPFPPISYGLESLGKELQSTGVVLPDVGPGSAGSARKSTTFEGSPTRTVALYQRNDGLGQGMGGQLARSALGTTAYMQLDPVERQRQYKKALDPPPQVLRDRKFTRLPHGHAEGADPRQTPRQFSESVALKDGPEPQGMFKQLLLSDLSWATEPTAPLDLNAVREHRWAFRGAVELAERGQSHCFFIRCLLDMQRNVQCEEEGDALDPELTRACKLFVGGQCGVGKSGEMYQLLTHFISNAIRFDEWERYLKDAFAHERHNDESFLVPHLEQVWSRFCRILPTLDEIFAVLNTRFVWRHRLPKVDELVRESLKRRCFSSKAVINNEIMSQEKCNNETVKNVKRHFKLGH
jgi:hypothetical protein